MIPITYDRSLTHTWVERGVSPPAVYDRVTLLLGSNRPQVVHGSIQNVSAAVILVWIDGPFREVVRHAQTEGASWIRGTHKHESEEVRAMEVAYALTKR